MLVAPETHAEEFVRLVEAPGKVLFAVAEVLDPAFHVA
jgi:hypothetical protein